MESKLYSLIIEKDFEEIKKYKEIEIRKVLSYYQKGYITEEEKIGSVRLILYEGYDYSVKYLLRTLGLYTMTYEMSNLFIEDYYLWKKSGNIIGAWYDNLKIDWYDVELLLDAEVKLSALEIIELVDSLLIPISYFRCVPSNIPDPNVRVNHVYGNQTLYTVLFDCIDDDGLLTDNDPVGKTFELTRKDGVKAHFTVTVFRPKGTIYKYSRHVDATENCDHYIGIGTIDDYYFRNTIPPSENMNISVFGKERPYKICDIGMTAFLFKDGFSEFTSDFPGCIYSSDFPRWKEYHNDRHKRFEAIEVEENELLNRLTRCE